MLFSLFANLSPEVSNCVRYACLHFPAKSKWRISLQFDWCFSFLILFWWSVSKLVSLVERDLKVYFGGFEEQTFPRLQSSLLALKLDPFTSEVHLKYARSILTKLSMNPPICLLRLITVMPCRVAQFEQRYSDSVSSVSLVKNLPANVIKVSAAILNLASFSLLERRDMTWQRSTAEHKYIALLSGCCLWALHDHKTSGDKNWDESTM